MRWDNLRLDAEQDAEQTALPGYRDSAAVRRFDAPEALDTRFYEVRARSALNRVPEASQMPFRWTVNPYRGCSHACVYCLVPETPVLLADGRQQAIGELPVGARIIGTAARGAARRFVETEVLARWSTVKDAFRVTLEDGTTLTASGDHRFLTSDGWRHVTGDGGREHLTVGARLVGFGALPPAPEHDASYMRGYLCGMVRGDGNPAALAPVRGGRRAAQARRFRLVLPDPEALARSQGFLAAFGVTTEAFEFAPATDRDREIRAIRTSAQGAVDAVHDLVRWPAGEDDLSWCRGFVAGVFDAGGHRGDRLSVCSGDREIVGWTVAALRRLGFRSVVEEVRRGPGLGTVRLLGGEVAQQRLLHLVGSAVTRKRSPAGRALGPSAALGIVAVEPLGERLDMVDITTGTGDFIADGVVSHNCFARPTHTYLGFDAGRDFEREIVVKVNAPEVLAAELRRPSWKGEHVAMGTNTDPYQWVEGRYELMRGIWAALRDARNPCSVLTKSPLLLRDLDLLLEVADVAEVTANLSIPTLDEKAWRATEPRTPNPRARIEAVAELNRAGIPCGVLVAPLMPGINDDPRQVEEILRLVSEAGATSVGGIGLHLRGEVRGIFLDWLRSSRPDLVEHYEELYAGGAYAPAAERERLARLLRRPGVPERATAFRRQVGAHRPAAPPRREAARQEVLF